jgi:ribA/ribD-fused uncharacterized protein
MASLTFDTSYQQRSYEIINAVIIYKTKEKFGGLSNMASGFSLQVNGTRILTSEALYQACRFPHIDYLQREIIKQISPMTAKRLCKPFLDQSRPDWDLVRVKVMRWCLRIKLAQNYETFGSLLLATKDAPIVEFSIKDDFWGAKPDQVNGNVLVGQNVLGRLLMELRELLKYDNGNNLKIVTPLNIPDFNLFGQPIETVSANQISSDHNPNRSLFS